jgi:integrase
MHDDLRHLDLTFPAIPVGEKQTPPNLRRLLYKGGASIRADQADEAIQRGLLGEVKPDRAEFVHMIHEYISGVLAGGGSPVTARVQIANTTLFFGWADTVGAALNISEVERTYLNWAEYLLHRFRVVKDIKQLTAYHRVRIVGQILDEVLGRGKPIVRATKLRSPRTRNTPRSTKGDKQNLHSTFAFGRLLQDICDGTPLSVIWGGPRVRIPLQQGGEIEYFYGREPRPEDERTKGNVLESSRIALAYEADRSTDHRFRRDLVNLRIHAELLMFIGQTGMNLAQAIKISLRSFSYSSDIDGYKVREYKPRRKGEVLFEIFSEYRGHFERYLQWRGELFPNTEKRLFPLIRRNGTLENQKIKFSRLKAACKKLEITWTPPSALRGTRVNWLLRRTGDPDMTAEMAQHHKQTLLNVYETPSLQRAVSEITRFHLRNDPALAGNALLLAVAPGECNGTPEASAAKPQSASEPDCVRPSGCLWCEHHRDVDSFDYVWSLVCFRHLKILELGQILPTKKESKAIHPAEHAIQRLSQKLSWFRESNAKRREWVEESLARVEEGYYHNQWSYLIEAREGPAK